MEIAERRNQRGAPRGLGIASIPASRDRARLVGSLELLAVRKAISLVKQSFAWSYTCGSAKRPPEGEPAGERYSTPKKGGRA